MMEEIFKNKRLDVEKLKEYGFLPTDGQGFVWQKLIMDKQFLLNVFVFENGSVKTRLTDTETNEDYVLHLTAGTCGAFVGQIREEIRFVLEDIAKKCFVSSVFKTVEALEVIRYMAQKYDIAPEYLWEKFPMNAVFRRKDNKKWICAILTAAPAKLGLSGEGLQELLDLRGYPEKISEIIDNKKYFPAYHMNKKHWFTLCFNGSAPMEEIYRRIDESYCLAKK